MSGVSLTLNRTFVSLKFGKKKKKKKQPPLAWYDNRLVVSWKSIWEISLLRAACYGKEWKSTVWGNECAGHMSTGLRGWTAAENAVL